MNNREHLIKGLVGDRGDEYANSATFYHSVNLLADLLPTWVDGMAANASDTDERITVAFRAMERGAT